MSDVPRKLIPIPDARERLGGIGNTTIYRLINDGHITKVNIGRRGFITADSIDAYIDTLRDTPTHGKHEELQEQKASVTAPKGQENKKPVAYGSVPVADKESVRLTTYSDNPVYGAHQFDEHPTCESVDVTRFVREEAMQAQPIILAEQTIGKESHIRIGYFLTHTEVHTDADGKQTVLRPTTRSTYEETKAWIRNLRADAIEEDNK